jgi:cytoskeletal protein RodZ
MPARPSGLRDMPDDEVFALLRKIAYANAWDDSAKVQFEATARTIAALQEFRDGTRRAAHATFFLTAVLVVLMLILLAMTGVLVWLTTRI